MSATQIPSHQFAHQALNEILDNFDVPRLDPSKGISVKFIGRIPDLKATRSEKINLTLIGAIPATGNAVTAAQIFQARGGSPQQIEIDLRRSHNYLDPDIGMTPTVNGQEITLDVIAGNPFNQTIFETKDGKYVLLSAVYVDLAYQWSAFLGSSIALEDLREAVKKWNSKDLESAAEETGMPFAICQTEASWRQTQHGAHMLKLPIVNRSLMPRKAAGLPSLKPFLPMQPSRPLSGLKVLCATHAIAGPSAGRTLAEHGASVLQVMYTHGFEHSFVYTYANLGTASTRLNFNREGDRLRMWQLVKEAHVYIDSHRPGATAKFGFTDEKLVEANPQIIICRLSCYGTSGPWAPKPGFDMQGSASSGLMGIMGEGIGDGKPQWPPGMVINDYTTGYYAALAVQSCILKRLRGVPGAEGAWLVSPSLTGTAMSIVKYFKSSRWVEYSRGKEDDDVALPPEELHGQTSLGVLKTLKPLPKMTVTPIQYEHGLLSTMGSSIPSFPGYDDGYDTQKVVPILKHDLVLMLAGSAHGRIKRLRQAGIDYRKKFGEPKPIERAKV